MKSLPVDGLDRRTAGGKPFPHVRLTPAHSLHGFFFPEPNELDSNLNKAIGMPSLYVIVFYCWLNAWLISADFRRKKTGGYCLILPI